MNSTNHEDEHEGKKLTRHYLNLEQARGLEESGKVLGPATDGNMMLNRIHEMYAVSDGEAMLHGGLPSADDAYCVGEACHPKHEGARKTNRMILDSYEGTSER